MARIDPKDAVGKKVLLNQYEPTENEYNRFLDALKELKSKIDDKKLESANEDFIRDFLKDAFYKSTNEIVSNNDNENRIDLAIYSDAKAKGKVLAIIEVKSTTNQIEFLSDGKINAKALQETVLYYMRESVIGNNKYVQRIVITNAKQWYIFDAKDFERLFVEGNKELQWEFKNFKKSNKPTTGYFYSSAAQKAIEEAESQLDYVYFDIQQLTKQDDLIDVFKILSPYYLLNAPCATDSNILNDKFYKELLHIIGLYENDKEENGKKKKKTIERLPENERESGSLLENAITQLSYQRNPFNLFDRAIQLVIVWTNRILFLKLLEAQLVKWHNNDKHYKFLTFENLSEYDDLKELFFGVLAKRKEVRSPELAKYNDIPYLNSSLFEQTEELDISALKDKVKLTVYKSSVLKDMRGQEMNPLEYLFRFLDAYDFGATESEDGLRRDSKTLINASVLGLIFEKINGYKDGSFYTPGTITQYMCEQAIQRAVIQKFNNQNGWNCQTLKDVKNQCREYGVGIDDKNKIINTIRICDPAVGSGHFLVSALNELIRIKYELGALCSVDGELLDGNLRIENDELFVTYDDKKEFVYNQSNEKSQKIQETLFNEKRNIIENCLFGVDINQNSVNICRLRLWIELLKNAYYKNGELETLPNIDINIKCGNSLVSRFDFNVDISKVLKKKEIDDYKAKVKAYKETRDKNIKHELEGTIEKLKATFRDSVQQNSSDFKDYVKYKGTLVNLSANVLFERTEDEKKKIAKQRENLEKKIAEYEEKQKNSIYENALEWRFEFPETLDDEGNFLGFDVVIGNPPYIDSESMTKKMPIERIYYAKKYTIAKGNWDISIPFFELATLLCKDCGEFGFIVPNKLLVIDYANELRQLLKSYKIHSIRDYSALPVFLDADVYPIVLLCEKDHKNDGIISFGRVISIENVETNTVSKNDFDSVPFWDVFFRDADTFSLIRKLLNHTNLASIKDLLITDAATVSEAYLIKEKIIDDNTISNCFRIVNTGTIDRYNLLWGQKDMQYIKAKYKYPVIEKDALQEISKNRFKQSSSGKIIIAGMSKIIEAAFDDGSCLAGKSTAIVYGVDCKQLKFLLAIFNSSVASFIINILSHSKKMSGGYLNIGTTEIGALPIPITESNQQQQIIAIVDKIVATKKQDPQTDTSKLEREIDLLVYHLYGLTFDEAKMIDETVTEEDFATAQ